MTQRDLFHINNPNYPFRDTIEEKINKSNSLLKKFIVPKSPFPTGNFLKSNIIPVTVNPLIKAFNCLALNHGQYLSRLFQFEELSRYRNGLMSIFLCFDGAWKKVVIDDLIPFRPKLSYSVDNNPLKKKNENNDLLSKEDIGFTYGEIPNAGQQRANKAVQNNLLSAEELNDKEVTVEPTICIIEKALAKSLGCYYNLYQQLDKANMIWVLGTLTGSRIVEKSWESDNAFDGFEIWEQIEACLDSSEIVIAELKNSSYNLDFLKQKNFKQDHVINQGFTILSLAYRNGQNKGFNPENSKFLQISLPPGIQKKDLNFTEIPIFQNYGDNQLGNSSKSGFLPNERDKIWVNFSQFLKLFCTIQIVKNTLNKFMNIIDYSVDHKQFVDKHIIKLIVKNPGSYSIDNFLHLHPFSYNVNQHRNYNLRFEKGKGDEELDAPILRILIGMLKKGNFQFVTYQERKGKSQMLDLELVKGEYVILTEVQKSCSLNTNRGSLHISGDGETQLAIFTPVKMKFSQTIESKRLYAFVQYMIFKNFLVKQIKNSQKINQVLVNNSPVDILLYRYKSQHFYIIPNGTKQTAIKIDAQLVNQNEHNLRFLGSDSETADRPLQTLRIKPMNFEYILKTTHNITKNELETIDW